MLGFLVGPAGVVLWRTKEPGNYFRGSLLPTTRVYEQPKLSPQFKHLKHAPLRTATWPQLGQVGASFIKCSTASLRFLISRRPLPLALPPFQTGTVTAAASSDSGSSGTGRFTFFFSSSSSPGIASSGCLDPLTSRYPGMNCSAIQRNT